MRFRPFIIFCLSLMLSCGALLPAAEPTAAEIAELEALSRSVDQRAQLALRVIQEKRREALEYERRDILAQIDRWRSGEDDLEAADYHNRLEQALVIAEEYGLDIDRMRALHELMKKVILRTDFVNPEDTGEGTVATMVDGVKQYFDWATGEEERMAKAQEMRVGFYKKAMLFYLQALVERDPAAALANFERYLEALKSFQIADAEHLINEAQKIVDEQRLVVDIAVGFPLLGDALDILALYHGEDLAGKKLTDFDKNLILFFQAGLPIIGQVIKRVGPSIMNGVGYFVAFVYNATKPQLDELARLARTTADDLRRLAGSLDEMADVRRAREVAEEGLRALRRAVEAIDNLDNLAAGVRNGTTSIDEFQRALIEAQNQLKSLRPEHSRVLSERLARIEGDFLQGVKEAAEAAVRNSDELSRLEDAWQAAERLALERIQRMQELIAAGRTGSPEFLELYQAIRMDKRSLKELVEGGEQYVALRTAIKAFEDGMIDQVDGQSIRQLTDAIQSGRASGQMTGPLLDEARKTILSQLKAKLQKMGIPTSELGDDIADAIDWKNVEFKPFGATNKPPAPDKLGMDRDITYQIYITVVGQGDNMRRLDSPIIVDVPAALAERAYYENLGRALGAGSDVTSSWENLRHWGAEGMDHVVTDALALDAYRLGMDDITRFFADPSLLPRDRVTDFASTVFHKSDEWFERARHNFGEAASQGGTQAATRLEQQAMREMTEGMRQASKQYNNYMSAVLQSRNLGQVPAVPAHVRQGMDIFNALDKRQMSYPEAVEALRRIGTSPETVVRDFAAHFEMVLKLQPR